jgi:hypothetical protein
MGRYVKDICMRIVRLLCVMWVMFTCTEEWGFVFCLQVMRSKWIKLLQCFVFGIVLNVKFYPTSFSGIDAESGSQTELRTVVKSIELVISFYIRILPCGSSFERGRSGIAV